MLRIVKCPDIQAVAATRLQEVQRKWFRPYEQHKDVVDSSQQDPKFGTLVSNGPSGFADAACMAYSYHLPLTLSPTIVQIRVLQSISRFINENPEASRAFVVRHEGKKELVAEVAKPSYVDGINQAFRLMNEDCKLKFVVTGLTDDAGAAAGNDPTACLVARITALDTVKAFYTYTMISLCGIPEYHIEGTPEQWDALIAWLPQFRVLGAEVRSWIDNLVPLLQAINRADYSKDKKFWQTCVRTSGIGSGGEMAVDGWLLRFYLHEDGRGKSQFMANTIARNAVPLDNLPQDISKVPFHVNWLGTEFDIDVMAGIMGVTQDPATGALRPSPAWVAVKADDKTG